QLLVRPSVSNEDVKTLSQCTAIGLISTVTESVSSASGGTGLPLTVLPVTPFTVTTSVKLLQRVTPLTSQEMDPPGCSVCPMKLALHAANIAAGSRLVTLVMVTGNWGREPSMQTAWIVILKQKAEHCDPFSFFMPHALVCSLPFTIGANGSQPVSGLTQTTCSKIRMQELQQTTIVHVCSLDVT